MTRFLLEPGWKMQTNDESDDFIDHADEPEREGPPEDPKVDEARAMLVALFAENPNTVFYERQIVVRLEDDFFHWITAKALHQLVDDREIGSEKLPLFPGLVTGSSAVEIRAYWARNKPLLNRVWK